MEPIEGQQTTKKLTKTQIMILEARKSAPPLTITQRPTKEFVVLQEKRFDDNSLFGRFLKHQTTTEDKNEDNGHNVFKLWQLKDKLTQEMENKRIESEKYREINDKLENEDIEEIDEEVDDNDEEEEDKNEIDKTDKNHELANIPDEDKEECDEESEEKLEDEDEEEECDDEEDIEDGDDEEEEAESEHETNPFVNDEAEEDDEEENISIYESQSKRRQIVTDIPNGQSLTKEPVNEESNSNHSMGDTSENESTFKTVCATQKVAVSPFITQRPKSVFNNNPKISELIPNLNMENEEFNSQSLVDLCSGQFTETIVNKTISEEEDNSDEEFLSSHKNNKKVFNIESEDESDCDENKLDSQSVVSSLKMFNESDGEDLVLTDEEKSDAEEDADNEEEKEETNVNSFFDVEAELSGSEASSDEDEDEDDDQPEEEGEQEDLPSDSELKDQIGRYHHKRLIDEDKRELMILKEMMFEDGDLHEDGKQRERKFRWNFDGDDNFVNDYINEDSDDNYMDSDEDEKTKIPVLRMAEKKLEETSNTNMDLLKSKLKDSFKLKNINRNVCIKSSSGVNSLSAFVVRDQRLQTVMSVENKRSLSDGNGFKSNKRFKDSKKTKKSSIFDLLD